MNANRCLFGPRILFIGLLLLFTICTFAQVGINTDNSNPDPSAMLHVQSTDGGMLIPRMTASERDMINAPATGLMVYVLDDNLFYRYNCAKWAPIGQTEVDYADLLPEPGSTCDLELANSLALGSQPRAIAVAGDFAYVVERMDNELQVIDISSPSTPSLTTTFVIGNDPKDLVLQGNYAYVILTGDNVLKIVDISNPLPNKTLIVKTLSQTDELWVAIDDPIVFPIRFNSLSSGR